MSVWLKPEKWCSITKQSTNSSLFDVQKNDYDVHVYLISNLVNLVVILLGSTFNIPSFIRSPMFGA